MLVGRKGGGEQGGEPTEDDSCSFEEGQVDEGPAKKKKKTITITKIEPHLNIAALTHPQHQFRQSVAEEKDPIGNISRQSYA